MDEAKFRDEVREDLAAATKAMAAAHHLFHGPGGFNKCELDPCDPVCVLFGDVAVMLMMARFEPETAA